LLDVRIGRRRRQDQPPDPARMSFGEELRHLATGGEAKEVDAVMV
jgi:hypothetical protein